MFRTYQVGNSFGILFGNSTVLVAGRHPEKVQEKLVVDMNKIHDILPKASYRAIQMFVESHFDFEEAYNETITR